MLRIGCTRWLSCSVIFDKYIWGLWICDSKVRVKQMYNFCITLLSDYDTIYLFASQVCNHIIIIFFKVREGKLDKWGKFKIKVRFT